MNWWLELWTTHIYPSMAEILNFSAGVISSVFITMHFIEKEQKAERYKFNLVHLKNEFGNIEKLHRDASAHLSFYKLYDLNRTREFANQIQTGINLNKEVRNEFTIAMHNYMETRSKKDEAICWNTISKFRKKIENYYILINRIINKDSIV